MNIGLDCSTALTSTTARLFKNQQNTFVGRYITPGSWKSLTVAEVASIKAAGLQILSVFERTADRTKGGATTGSADGKLAYGHARTIGQPLGSAIYFAVDYDAQQVDYDRIEAYLRAAAIEIPGYKLGVYGSFYVIEEMHKRDVCSYYWQTVAWSRRNISKHANVFQRQIDISQNGIGIDLNEQYSEAGLWGQTTGEEGYKMQKPDADKIIALLQQVYAISPSKEVGRLADEVRKASNQPTQNS
jgi:hypothetical protein